MKDKPDELIRKARDIKAPADALDHMLSWMITNSQERQALMDEILGSSQS